MLELKSVITDVPFIGPVQAKRLENLNIYHVVDLLTHFPSKYIDSSNLISVEQLLIDGEGTIKGEIVSITSTYTRNRKVIIKAKVKDETSVVEFLWFNQAYLTRVFKEGKVYIFQAKRSKRGSFVCNNYEEFKEGNKSLHLGRISPQYPQTAKVSSKWLRSRIKHVLDNCKDLEDFEIPDWILEKYEMIDLREALDKIHFPESEEDIDVSRKRLSFDELLTLQLQIEEKKAMNQESNSVQIPFDPELYFAFQDKLPFKLSNDQKETIKQIGSDMSMETPMHRLVNGDVGSGKTVVALGGIIQALNGGFSVIFLAPTTILAKQHFDNTKEMIDDFGFESILVTSEAKNEIPDDDKPRLIIGTHAILHRDNLPGSTALIVIDEQHRFGVNQRKYIRDKVTKDHQPHYLMMTATPIPRTLTNTLYGDMEVSFIESMPHRKGSKETFFVPKKRRDSCYKWVADRVSESREQAFVVFPLIEEDPEQSDKSVKSNFKTLSKTTFKDLRCELLHGKVKSNEKNKIMEKMRDGKIDVLFSTTVIEVGMDIPNATIIVIEGSELFGLAQLHQLRGRVGRNEMDSFCYLIPTKDDLTSIQEDRLRYFSKNNSGFDISEYDLQTRGPGEVFGTKQAGIPDLLIASILSKSMIKNTKGVAKTIFGNPDRGTLQTIFSLRRNLNFET